MNWHPLVQIGLQALSVTIATLIPILIVAIIRKISASHLSDKYKDAYAHLVNLAGVAVSEVMQTTIDGARKAAGQDGTLPKDIAEQAKQAALAKVKAYTPKDILQAVATSFGLDTQEKIDAFIISHIESMVRLTKD